MLMAAKLAIAASNRAIEKAKKAAADCHYIKANMFLNIAAELTAAGKRYSNIYLIEEPSAVNLTDMETLRFGKYKGLTYEEVRKKSPSYFTWLWFNIKEKLDKPLYEYIETNIKELKIEADNEHAAFMYHYCNGEVAPEY